MKRFIISIALICLFGIANTQAGNPLLLKTTSPEPRALVFKPIELNFNTLSTQPILFKRSIGTRQLGKWMKIGGVVIAGAGVTLFQLYDSDGKVNSYIGMPLAYAGICITIGGSIL